MMKFCLVFAASFGPLYAEVVRDTAHKMGSPFAITVVHPDKAQAQAAINAAWEEIDRLEAMMSSWRESSQTSAVNRAAGQQAVAVSPELFRLVRRALKVSVLSDGAFDLTFASAGRFWDYRSGKLPNTEDIIQALEGIDYRHIRLDEQHSSIFLTHPKTRIGFGAIGKGFAANRALWVLREQGVKNALVNAGGDLVAMGRQEDGRPWHISIAHPRQPKTMLAGISLTEQAIVTSGDYERFIMVDGKRYSHILDPRTGFPVTGLISATLICPDAELADALATAVFVMGKDQGMKLVNRLKGVEAILVDDQENVFYSKNLRDQPGIELPKASGGGE